MLSKVVCHFPPALYEGSSSTSSQISGLIHLLETFFLYILKWSHGLSYGIFIYSITLIFLVLHQLGIHGINHTWYDVLLFLYIVGFNMHVTLVAVSGFELSQSMLKWRYINSHIIRENLSNSTEIYTSEYD